MAREFRRDNIPVIETTGGRLKGYFYNGAYIFKGIPYAWADRFQMPRPTSWEGVRDACSYGFVCPLTDQDTPTSELMVPHRYWPQDEHCQNLNIWTKSLERGTKAPVIVWLHGGGYFAGSSIEQVAYDGYNACMEGDVVVVSINHRLNVLGYLDLSPFGEKYANSGNAGHADMVAALQWIHDNIEAFGGDPGNVTIFGQSGGGMKVADLMQIQAADGLFHKGLIMSGVGDKRSLSACTGDGRAIVGALLSELGIPADLVEKLEDVPYRELVNAYKKVSPAVAGAGGYIGGGPLVNEYYKGGPVEYGFREHAYSIPLLIGTVFGEFAFAPNAYDKAALSPEEAVEKVAAVYGGHAQEMIAAFAEAYPGKCPTDLLAVDRAFRQPSKELARLHAQGGQAKAYLYNFTLEFPIHHNKIAWHCSDIPFFFHNTDKVEVCAAPGFDKLESRMFGAFMAFARTGDPNMELLPRWPAVTPQEEPTMILDQECEVRTNYDDKLYSLIDACLPPFRLMESLAGQDVQH